MNFALFKSHLMTIAIESINFTLLSYTWSTKQIIKQINLIVQTIYPVYNNRAANTKSFTLSRRDWHAKLVIIYPFYRKRQKPYKNHTLSSVTHHHIGHIREYPWIKCPPPPKKRIIFLYTLEAESLDRSKVGEHPFLFSQPP